MEKKNGIPLIILGLIGFFVASSMDTTVAAYDNERVFNIGLMNRQQNSIILSAISLIVGTLIQLFGKDNKKKEFLDQVDYQGDRNTKNSNYQLFLTRKFSIEHNSTLNKYVISNDVFDNLDAAMEYANNLYENQLLHQEELRQINVDKVRARQEDYSNAMLDMRTDIRKIPSELYKRKLPVGLLIVVLILFGLNAWRVKMAEEEKQKQVLYDNLTNRDPELRKIFGSGDFFGYKVTDTNLAAVSKSLGVMPSDDFVTNSRLSCFGSQCDVFTKKSNLAGKLKSIAFSYCRIGNSFNSNLKFDANSIYSEYRLIGVSLDLDYEMNSSGEVFIMLQQFAATEGGTSLAANMEIIKNDLGVGLFSKDRYPLNACS